MLVESCFLSHAQDGDEGHRPSTFGTLYASRGERLTSRGMDVSDRLGTASSVGRPSGKLGPVRLPDARTIEQQALVHKTLG